MASRELQLAIQLCQLSRRRSRPTFAQLGRMAELRAEYDAIAEAHSLPADVKHQPIDADGVSAEWISGPEMRDHCVMLYLHGGCYATGSVETHRDLIARLSIAASMRVLGLNYRLAPAYPFPAAIEDASTAYRWLLKLGRAPSQIAIAGDSAGAGLALAAMLTIRDEGLPLPGCVACLSPWVDLALTGASMERKAGEDPIVGREMLLGWGNLYLAKTIRPHRSRHLCMPICAGFHRCSYRLDRQRFCWTTPLVWPNAPWPPVSILHSKSGRR